MASESRRAIAGPSQRDRGKKNRNDVRWVKKREHRPRLDALTKLQIEATKFYCTNAARECNIAEDCVRLISNIGAQDFLMDYWPTYARCTLEFLSSLEVTRDPQTMEPLQINFQLMNVDRSMTVDQIQEIFKLPKDGIYKPPDSFNAEELWHLIVASEGNSNVQYNVSASKTSRVRNPVFRYILRLLACTIYARGEPGNVRKDELFILWCMLTRTRVNLVALWIDHLWRVSQKKTGCISVGGLLTPLCTYFGVDCDEDDCGQLIGAEDGVFLDIHALTAMRSVRRDGSTIWLLQVNGDPFPLKYPQLTTVDTYENRVNWRLDTPAHYVAQYGNRVNRSIGRETDEEGQNASISGVQHTSNQESLRTNPNPLEKRLEEFILTQERWNQAAEARDNRILEMLQSIKQDMNNKKGMEQP